MINASKIRSGLYQMKQFLSRSKPKSTPQRQPEPTSYYKPIPSNSRTSDNFYMNNAPSSQSNFSANMHTAPPPASLPSLRDSFLAHSNNTQVDDELNNLLTQLDAAIEENMNATSLGPLAVADDLKLYEDFLRIEAIRTPTPENEGNLKNLAGGDYALERDTEWHKSALLMSQLIEYYRINYFAEDIPLTFSEFVTTVSVHDLISIWKIQGDQQAREFIHRFKQGVRYLSAEKREKYNVTSKSGSLYWAKWGDSVPLDTTVPDFYKRKHQPLHTFGNDTLAIWVLSREHKLYTHSAKVHRFHHSSFTSGDLVYCAGDWEVKNGKLQWISAASGHYKPTFDNFKYAVEAFGNKFGLNANQYKVKVYEDSSKKFAEKLIPAREFLFNFNYIKNQYRLSR